MLAGLVVLACLRGREIAELSERVCVVTRLVSIYHGDGCIRDSCLNRSSSVLSRSLKRTRQIRYGDEITFETEKYN